MRKTLRGFSFFEVILYLGLFSVMATALLQFSWNVLDLGIKDRTSRHVFSDGRFVTERINYFIRSAAGIDTSASVFDNANGKLVLTTLGSSNTVTIEIQNGAVVLTETGQPTALLNGSDSKVASLTFLNYGTGADDSEYIAFTLGLASTNDTDIRAPYQATTTLQSGAFIRNSGVGL